MKLNLKQLLRERQIEKPYGYLVKNGFPRHVALALLKDNADRLQIKYLDKLCRLLWCTPNELFIMSDASLKKQPLPTNHPLHSLQPRTDAPDLLKKLRELPIEKLKEMEKLMG